MTRDRGSVFTSALLVVVCLVVGWVLLGCGAQTSSAPLATDPTVPPTIEVVPKLPAFAVEHADRSTLVPPTVEQAAPFDPVAYVDGLPYAWTIIEPAMEAFRVVALVRGWPQTSIDRWSPFVHDVISKESGGCPNAVGGDLFVVGTCDQYQRKGRAEDSGLGQATTALYGRTGTLCTREGICSQWQIISSPWVSAVSLVAALEHHGRYPWCDYVGAPAYHDCGLIGRNERPL